MPVFLGKTWFRAQIAPYLSVIKTELTALASVTGQYAGKGATFATLPTVDKENKPLLAGDWCILTTDTLGSGTAKSPQYPAGVYVRNVGSTAWELVQESTDLGDVLLALVATGAEVQAGTEAGKVANVVELAKRYAKLNGTNAEIFNVSAGNKDTDEALNANQFSSVAITSAEAQADFTAA